MNFFERQQAARKHTSRLIFLFALAVLGIVLAVDMGVYIAFVNKEGTDAGGLVVVMLFTSMLTLGIIGMGSLYRIVSLRKGGDAVARELGGVPVAENTTDLQERRLRNVVEEIAIASGVPVPKIYVLPEETAINAFAAGYSPSDAAIVVTGGALQKLNRDELQGVIAHEFSHVLNGDMRLNIRLIGLLFGILMIGLIGRKILVHGSGGRGKGGGAVIGAALCAMAVGYAGLFFGRMIKAGVSRSREKLADASAVQFTRQTAGLAGALKKIGGVGEGSRFANKADAEEVAHMLFGDGVGYSRLFATHPPLLERIQALEPGFKDAQLQSLAARWAAMPPNGLEEDVAMGLDGGSGSRLPGASAQISVSPPMVSAQVAQPAGDDFRRADTIVSTLPDALRDLAAQRDSVIPLCLGLLLDRDDVVRMRQITEITARLGAQVSDHARRIQEQLIDELHPMLRLPLASMALPVLRTRPRPELDAFLDTVYAVVNADGQVSPFEYCLGKLLQVQIREALDPAKYARFGRKRLNQVRSEIAGLLCVVAEAGHDSEQSARHAYLAGMQRVLPNDHIPYQVRQGGVTSLDPLWEPLDALDPLAKQSLVEAITAAISHDGKISVTESELLRTICGVLHCPLPPMLENQTQKAA